MKECIYRRLSEKDSTKLKDASGETSLMVTFGLKQDFSKGICSLLTSYDMGPVRCLQSECDENDCPDIEEYREK